jgi:hypothetical protein
MRLKDKITIVLGAGQAASCRPGARPRRRAPDARDQTGLGRRPELRLVEEQGC